MKPTKTATISLGAGVLFLLGGLLLLVVGSRPPPERTFRGTVKDLLPDPDLVARAGWSVAYLPIADTPEMKTKVEEALNYDDAIFVNYANGTERISVYIAYWSPGKMPYRLVAGHNPDVCWVGGGWQILEGRSDVILRADSKTSLPPGEIRKMILNGRAEYIAFWHLLDGKPKSYGTKGKPPWHALFADVFVSRLNQRPEQFFVRISDEQGVPFESGSELYAQLAKTIRPVFQNL